MSKRDVVDVIQAGANLESKAVAERTLKAIQESIVEELAAGNEVLLRGFGAFKVKTVAERMGRDFKTGKGITIPAKKTLKFEAGTELKASVAKGRAATYLQNMESRFGAFKKTLEELGRKETYRDQLGKLHSAYEESRYKLTLLQNATGDAWSELRHGFEQALQDLRQAFTKARARF